MPPSADPQTPEPAVPGDSGEPADSTPDSGAPFDVAAMPDAVRQRIAELAAAALGRLPVAEVPRQLRPVARFAPAKRAKVGGAALLGTLSESAKFRAAVLDWLREHRADALDPNDPDPVCAAAAAVLLGEADAASRLRVVAKHAAETELRAERDAARARAQRLEAEVERLRADLTAVRAELVRAREERDGEADRLRRRLREQGVALRQAKDAAAAAASAGSGTEEQVAKLTEQLRRERERVAAERARADKAAADAQVARQSAREARQAEEVRLALLVDTLEGAVAGLRRELALGSGGTRPADLVAGATAAAGRGGKVRDAAALDRVLGLPSLHLIVDGYNVTKTGYPELSLADQRDRLARQLSALAARTGAEVTVVFDGAGVISVPTTAPRGVRVLFSEANVLADDVIRELVAAEPDGRPVLVATSDRAVVDSIRAAGAHSVPSAILLARLGHG